MNLHSFPVIATALHDPLVLVGFGLLLVFEVCRQIVRQIPKSGNSRLWKILLPQIVRYGFFVAFLLILLGFGLQWQRDQHASIPDNHPKNGIEGGIHGENNTATQSIRLGGTNAKSAGFHQPVGQKDRNASENHFSGGIHGNGNTVKQSINTHEEPE